MTTIIQPVENPGNSSRKAARMRRLMRLRTTARLLTLVLTVMPMRVGDRPDCSAARLASLAASGSESESSKLGLPSFPCQTGHCRNARSVKLRVLRLTPD